MRIESAGGVRRPDPGSPMEMPVDVKSPVLTARHAGDYRFIAEVRGHRIETDQPLAGGGSDSAAMPLELMAAALGTCVTLYAHRFLESRGLPVDGLAVQVATEMAYHPKRIGAFDVRVHLPDDVPEEYRERIERAAASCPAHATLAHPPEVRFSIEQAAALPA